MTEKRPPAPKPRRGRPTLSRVAEIDRTVIATARTLFIDGGYADTSMEAVAAAAAIAKGTLYARYPTKTDLFRAVVADRLTAWASAGLAPSDEYPDLEAVLLDHGRGFFAAMRNPDVAAFDRLILVEAGRFPELAEEFYRQGYLTGLDHLAAAIAAASDNVADSAGVASVFMSALLGWWRNEAIRRQPTAEDCEALLRRLVDLLSAGRASW